MFSSYDDYMHSQGVATPKDLSEMYSDSKFTNYSFPSMSQRYTNTDIISSPTKGFVGNDATKSEIFKITGGSDQDTQVEHSSTGPIMSTNDRIRKTQNTIFQNSTPSAFSRFADRLHGYSGVANGLASAGATIYAVNNLNPDQYKAFMDSSGPTLGVLAGVNLVSQMTLGRSNNPYAQSAASGINAGVGTLGALATGNVLAGAFVAIQLGMEIGAKLLQKEAAKANLENAQGNLALTRERYNMVKEKYDRHQSRKQAYTASVMGTEKDKNTTTL